jgi:hypothetical protein
MDDAHATHFTLSRVSAEGSTPVSAAHFIG